MGRPASNRSTQLAEERTDLALQRTVIAADRTLMAWIRTSISMIGFGFSIYKFMQYIREAQGGLATLRPDSPRNFGLALIALGTVALVAAIWQHRDFMKRIGAADQVPRYPLSVIVALLVVLIGIIAFIGVMSRVGPF